MELLSNFFSMYNLPYLGLFLVFFGAILAVDIRAHNDPNSTSLRDAAKWSLIWLFIATPIWGAVTYYMMGAEQMYLYFSGVVLEKALAVDNLFAFMAIFSSFGLLAVNKRHIMHRILLWGIIGAIVLRALFLGFGAAVVSLPTASIFGLEVNIVFLLFALAILWTVKLMWAETFGDDDDDEEEVDYTKHWSVKVAKTVTGGRVDATSTDGSFFVMKDGVRYATAAFLCLVCIEFCDIIFAFDSMPVIVAVVKDPNIMLTATLMACAGLRSLYFVLMELRSLFCHLDKAVVFLLVFISGKLIAASFGFHVPIAISMSIVIAMVTMGIVGSLIWPEKDEDEAEA